MKKVIAVTAMAVQIKGAIEGNRINSYEISALGLFIGTRKNINEMRNDTPYL